MSDQPSDDVFDLALLVADEGEALRFFRGVLLGNSPQRLPAPLSSVVSGQASYGRAQAAEDHATGPVSAGHERS